MHPTAMRNCESFFDCYANSFASTPNVRVVEIGSQDVNGSLRSVCPKQYQYIGVDFSDAKGVDVVLKDPYSFPFENEYADIFLSSSCFEHSEFFWLVYLEILRCLKPGGLFYLNVPSSGGFHRYPVDCWRFYPDSGQALVNWAKRNGIDNVVLESYTQIGGGWQDYVAVFLKDGSFAANYPKRILDTRDDIENGQRLSNPTIINPSFQCQNDKKLSVIERIASGTLVIK
jgi:SAM-dependent methyltransferase